MKVSFKSFMFSRIKDQHFEVDDNGLVLDEILAFASVGLYVFYLFFQDFITLTWVCSPFCVFIPIFVSSMGFTISFEFLLNDRV